MCVLFLEKLLDGGGRAVGRGRTADEEDVQGWAITDSVLQRHDLVSIRSNRTDNLKPMVQEGKLRGTYGYMDLEPSSHGIWPFPFFVDEVVLNVQSTIDHGLRQAAGSEVGLLEHAQNVNRGYVEELHALGEGEDP